MQSRVHETCSQANHQALLFRTDARLALRCAHHLQREGRFVEPLPRQFAIAAYWRGLSDDARLRIILRSTAAAHPNRALCSVSAAFWLGFTSTLHYHSHVHMASARRGGYAPRHVKLHTLAGDSAQADGNASGGTGTGISTGAGDGASTGINAGADTGAGDGAAKTMSIEGSFVFRGVRVVCVEQVLLDCARDAPFPEAMSIWDAALRLGATDKRRIAAYCDAHRLASGIRAARMLLRFSTPLAENGGESRARATMLMLGFAEPQVQVSFRSPATRGEIRPDFVWRINSCRTIAGEFDGMCKYTDESMRGGRSIEGVIRDEKDRETALNSLGMTVVRFNAQDVRDMYALEHKLDSVGVPRVYGKELTLRNQMRACRGRLESGTPLYRLGVERGSERNAK